MKTKIYLLIILSFLTLGVSAQKFNVMYMSLWTNNTWSDTLKTTATYDTNGHLIKLIAQAPNPQTLVWQNHYMINYVLNPDATVKEMTIQPWDDASQSWTDAIRTTFTYSASKKILTQTTEAGMDDFWFELAKTIYSYNANDLLSKQVQQIRDFLSMQWIDSEQTIYSYNGDGTESQNVLQIWQDQWVDSLRNTHTYNAAKKLISTLEEKRQNAAWINSSKTSVTYNPNDSISVSLTENFINNAWVNASRDQFSYNTNNTLAQVVTQDWNTTTSQWVNTGRIRYDYSTGINPVETAEKTWQVFPNPFDNQVTVKYGAINNYSIQLFNTTGQLVKSFPTNESVTNLNLGELKKGAYLMKIKSAQNEQTLKLLKAR